jgi:hypothetical protein
MFTLQILRNLLIKEELQFCNTLILEVNILETMHLVRSQIIWYSG